MAGNVNISSTEYIDSRNGASTIRRLKISVTKQDCPSPHSLANKIGTNIVGFDLVGPVSSKPKNIFSMEASFYSDHSVPKSEKMLKSCLQQKSGRPGI